VPADYDGDRRDDLSVKDAGGCWYIDYARDGFGAWNEIHCGYGNATAVPARGDYDGDGRADLSVKGSDGTWLVDYSSDGFGAWNASWCCRGGSTIAVPGDYDHDGKADLAVADTSSGYWYVDYAANGIATWDVTINNPARVLVDTARPYIKSTQVYGEGDVPTSTLTVGLRYTVDVTVEPGAFEFVWSGGVEINPTLGMPPSVKLMDPDGSTYAPIPTETHRRFAITCSEPGNFPLGFQLRSAPIYYSGSQVYNPDYGIRIVCAPPSQPGIMGKVTQRVMNAAGVYVAGSPIQGAAVTAMGLTTVTDAGGGWYLPLTNRRLTVHVSAPNHSDTIAVNVTVPDSGMEIDTPLEESFAALQAAGMNYTTYVDYSRGRTVFHTVHVDPRSAVVSAGKAGSTMGGCNTSACPSSTYTQCPGFDTLITTAQKVGAVAMINGMEFDVCNGNSVGYSYGKSGYLPSEVWCDDRYASTTNCYDSDVYLAEGGGNLYAPGNSPMFTITGLGAGQQFGIVQSDDNFLETSAEWRQLGNPFTPTWIASPINYAMQIPNPPLVANGAVIKGGDFVFDTYGNYDYAIARTSVGITPAGDLYLVVADGEGVMGGNGATGNQLAHFYRDWLGANYAMGLDSGLSTEMVLLGASGYRHVNTITGEDAAGLQVDPYAATVAEAPGAIGSVGYYLGVGAP
jgi:hypothetical protein